MKLPSYNQRESDRMRAVQAPMIPVVGALIKEHPGTISLGQGVVFYGPPPESIENLSLFTSDISNHQYKSVAGLPPLLKLIEEKLSAENKIEVYPHSCLMVTAGGNMAFMNAVLAIADAGDEIILQRPFYFNHEMAIRMAGCQPVIIDTDANYQPRPEEIRRGITQKTRAVVTVSPNNPTGAVYSEEHLRVINQICREHNIFHISDEAYEYFTYDDAVHFSPGSITGSHAHTISLFSLSKAYGFASWRIGYMVAPAQLFESLCKIQDTILICPPVISQFAAVGALQAGAAYCHEQIGELSKIRWHVQQELNKISDFCRVTSSDGAFYFFLEVETPMTSMNLVERLIREHGVAVMPGSTFGMEDKCYLRLSYAALERETVVEGVGRFVTGLRALV
jgi:aspartate/methionine/tyrosine aminotransferase